MGIMSFSVSLIIGGLYWSIILPICWKMVLKLQTLNDNFIQFMIGGLFIVALTFSSWAVTAQVYLYLGLEITRWTWGVPGYILLFLVNSGFYG